MQIPTILKGDDSGPIVLVMDQDHDYSGATLVVAYSGVTRKFTDLTPGGSVSLAFTHDETAGFNLGCKPVLMRLIGPSGAVETVENAEMKIKVTDCLGEVNAGGSFVIKPGAAGVPVTDVGDLSANANVGALYAKVNEIVRVLAQRSLLALAALLSTAASGAVQTTTLGNLNPSSVVVTNVTVDGAARPLPPYLHAIDFDDTYPEDAAWYYALPHDYSSCSAVRDGGFLSRNYDWRFDDSAEFVVRVSAGDGRFASLGVANCGTNLTEQFVTSGKWSRFYRCLPGRTVDGINENGVVAEVNVVGGDPHDRWPTNGTIHCMGAVRWVLDHATDAGMAASNLVEHLYFPDGFSQNFHWMIADATSTYIVENGRCSNVTGRAVMTNFPLLPTPGEGAGRERYELLLSSACCITNAWYTRAYSRETEWVSEFKSPAEMEAAKSAWETYGRDALRGKGIWQTVHCSVYDLTNRTLRVAVQERPDWYTFAVPGGTGVSPVQIREIVQPMIADATGEVVRLVGEKRDKTDLSATVADGWTDQWEPNSTLTPEKIERHETYYSSPQFDNGNWRCVTYIFDEEINNWVGYYFDFMLGDYTNPDATELTFPDGTVTHRVPALRSTSIATAIDLSNSVQRVERQLDDKADASALAPVAADAASAYTYSKFVYDFCLGSASCHLITTNYVFGSDALSRTRFAWQPDMDAATVPASMRLVDIVGGETNVVWDSRDWTVWYWNYRLAKYRAERETEDAALRALIASRCPISWASYTACGLTNPAATTTWLDTPSVVLSAGYAWQHQLDVGGVGYWCIQGNGFEVGGSGTNATLKISDFEGNEVFKIRKGNAMLAPVSSEMTEAVGFDGEWFWCQMKCDAQPEGEFAVDLAEGFYPEGDACPAVIREYEDRGGGVWRCYWKVRSGIQSAACFGRFKVQVGSETTVEYSNAPTFPAIRFGNYKLEPVIPSGARVGDTVTFRITEITQ